MYRRTSPLVLLWTLALLPALNSAEPGQDRANARPSLFSEEELAELERIAAAEAEKRQAAYIHASDDGEVIQLEPYVVEGDDGLLLARIRRELEDARRLQRPLMVGVTPAVAYAARFGRTGEDAFFRGYRLGMRDEKLVSGVDVVRAPFAIATAMNDGHLLQIFDAPPDAAGAE